MILCSGLNKWLIDWKVQNLELNSLNHIEFAILSLFWPFGNFDLEDFRLALMLFGIEFNANGDAGAISGDGEFVVLFF